MAADNAYRAARTPEQIRNVVAKYSSVYGGETEVIDFSLVFDGADIQVNANGKAWISSKA